MRGFIRPFAAIIAVLCLFTLAAELACDSSTSFIRVETSSAPNASESADSPSSTPDGNSHYANLAAAYFTMPPVGTRFLDLVSVRLPHEPEAFVLLRPPIS